VQHVTDACKLLRTSIVTIDQDRVDLEEDDDEAPAAAAEGDMDMNQGEDEDVMQDVTPTQETATQSAAPSTKVSIDAATYARMTRQIITKIQQEESTNDSKGVPRSELLEWWCELNEADLESQADLERENKLFVKVVKRMVKSDKSLQELVCFEELPEVDGDVGSGDDPVLSVNPAFYAMD
jgi:DNA replication licensing factor MCM6